MPKSVWIVAWASIFVACHFWLPISWAMAGSWIYGEPLALAQFAWLFWLYCDGLQDYKRLTDLDDGAG